MCIFTRYENPSYFKPHILNEQGCACVTQQDPLVGWFILWYFNQYIKAALYPG